MNVSQFKSTLSTNRITYFIDVVLPLAVPNYYSYRLPFELNGQVKIGQRVVVPLGKNKRYTAIVQCIHQKVPDYPVKYIEYVLDQEPIVTQNQLLLWEWIAGYYMCHVGEVMMAALPSSLKLASETRIVKKIFEWPKIIESSSRKFDLHKIPFYLYELSTLFHSYWSKGNEDKSYKFIENEKIKRKEILSIINLVALVIQNGMGILGVSLPKKM